MWQLSWAMRRSTRIPDLRRIVPMKTGYFFFFFPFFFSFFPFFFLFSSFFLLFSFLFSFFFPSFFSFFCRNMKNPPVKGQFLCNEFLWTINSVATKYIGSSVDNEFLCIRRLRIDCGQRILSNSTEARCKNGRPGFDSLDYALSCRG